MRTDFLAAAALAVTLGAAIWQNLESDAPASPGEAPRHPAAFSDSRTAPAPAPLASDFSGSFPQFPDKVLPKGEGAEKPSAAAASPQKRTPAQMEALRRGGEIGAALSAGDIQGAQDALLEARISGIAPVIRDVEISEIDLNGIDDLKFPPHTRFENVIFRNVHGGMHAPQSIMENVQFYLADDFWLFAQEADIQGVYITGSTAYMDSGAEANIAMIDLTGSRIRNTTVEYSTADLVLENASLYQVKFRQGDFYIRSLKTASPVTPLNVQFGEGARVMTPVVWEEDMKRGRYLHTAYLEGKVSDIVVSTDFSGNFKTRMGQANNIKQEMALLLAVMRDSPHPDPLTDLAWKSELERRRHLLNAYKAYLPGYSTLVKPLDIDPGTIAQVAPHFDGRLEMACELLTEYRHLKGLRASPERVRRQSEIRDIFRASGVNPMTIERPDKTEATSGMVAQLFGDSGLVENSPPLEHILQFR